MRSADAATCLLRGVTWAHTRGFAPLAALGRLWEDLDAGPTVSWETRSLWSFGEEPLSRYSESHDLIVFDYPFAGEALQAGWLIPLNDLVDSNTLNDIDRRTVGPLAAALSVDGQQAGLPVDVSTHVAAARMDLLEQIGEDLPADWDDTVRLAKESGKVAMPMRPTGVWGAFLTMCAHAGHPPMLDRTTAPWDTDVAAEMVERLRTIRALVPEWCLESYPVAMLNRMATSDEIAYIPLTYGYSLYSMRGLFSRPISFHDIRLGGDGVSGAILGGAAIGVSSRTKNPEQAIRHALWLVDEEIQGSLYGHAGGQPAAREAWKSPGLNALFGDYYANTIRSAEAAYVRPNFNGFHNFQNVAAAEIHALVRSNESPVKCLSRLSSTWLGLEQDSLQSI